MKKLLLIVFVAALLLGVVPVFATPTAQLNDLARYFPTDTPIFIASRFDDDYFQTLDAIIDRVRAVVPDNDIPPITIEQALNQALTNMGAEITFQGDVRPWLGDTIAAGVMNIQQTNTRRLLRGRMDGESPFAFAASITDRTAATNFITDMIARNGSEFDQAETGGFTILTDPDDPNGNVVIGDDVLLVTNISDFATQMPEDSLATNSTFTDAFADLPESDYNATVYLNLGDVLNQAMESDPDFDEIPPQFGALFNSIGTQVWGLTILDDVHFTVDVVSELSYLETYAALLGLEGAELESLMSPIDPSFAAHIPASAPLAVHSSNVGSALLKILEVFDGDTPFFDALGASADDMEEAQEALSEFEATFTRFTELDLREDVLSWMTGDYAMFLALNPDANFNSIFGLMTTIPVDIGLAVEVTDPAAAANAVAGLATGFDRLGALVAVGADEDNNVSFEITSESIAGTDVTVMTLETDEIPWPVELLMGANDEVFALGTRNAVQAILARDGGLPSNAYFASTQNLALDNTYAQYFLGIEGLLPLTDLAESMADEGDEANVAVLRDVLGLISGGIITQSIDVDGNAVSRAVLSLSE